MAFVDFLHHENPPTWAGVEPVTLGAEGQRLTNYATLRFFTRSLIPNMVIPLPFNHLAANYDETRILIERYASKIGKKQENTCLKGFHFFVIREGFCAILFVAAPHQVASTFAAFINRQVANRVAKNDANSALAPAFRYISIELPL
ncbi:UNVERIFIED_CONTAM: hypothetical protein NCL1_35317 [Trichonephila clavipes]